MIKPITKAVFPVAGLGTRFLPATKAMPKEMLPIVDKPLIQYAVEEARDAGIDQIIFVTGRGKTVLLDHFDHSFELEHTLGERGKTVSRLNPMGKAMFNNKYFEVSSKGAYIEADSEIEIVQVDHNKIIVIQIN